MSKETGVIVIGLWVFILPFLGIPSSWRTALLALTGIGLALLGFFLRSEAMGRSTPSSRAPFRDSEQEANSRNDETNVGEEIR